MASDFEIRAEDLGKKYLIGRQSERESYVSLRDVLARQAKGLQRNVKTLLSGNHLVGGDHIEDFWALKDVNFEIKRGEVVGIIGRNGAGKSTLLKILSRITEPTEGRVTLKGRMASLLEVGTGFHPELTGRENIYLNGSILGMSRSEIDRKFDEIVAFAEVERFLDTPVKRYSSGMYVRLAFSVAAHLEPDILVIDEVLAVGDAEFQRKCLGKMEAIGSSGRTVLFVSHNMQAVASMCSRALLMRGGRLIMDTTPAEALEAYLWRDNQHVGSMQKVIDGLPPDPAFKLHDVRLWQAGLPVSEDASGDEPLDIEVEFEVLQRAIGLRVVMAVCDEWDTPIIRTCHDENDTVLSYMEEGRYTTRLTIPAKLLGATTYKVRIMAGFNHGRPVMPLNDIVLPVHISRQYAGPPEYSGDSFQAKVAPLLTWVTQRQHGNSLP